MTGQKAWLHLQENSKTSIVLAHGRFRSNIKFRHCPLSLCRKIKNQTRCLEMESTLKGRLSSERGGAMSGYERGGVCCAHATLPRTRKSNALAGFWKRK